jgi:ABC-type multidrug transport system ATPase subunit
LPNQPPQKIPLQHSPVTIGRQAGNDIVLPVPYVSAKHGRLDRQGQNWRYTDLGSTNGTFINGKRTPSTTLNDGDVLRIGDSQGNSVSLTFRGSGSAGAPSGTIRIGTTTLQTQSTLLIGRDPQADIHLPAPVVSWHHAKLQRTPKGHVLIDQNSTNGTFVNGKRLTQPLLLSQGAKVQIGPFKLVYEASKLEKYATRGGMRLDGTQITRVVGRGNNRKKILHDINITIHPREFVALVGPSGAGKSTLLMALNGFARAEGAVRVDGDNLYQHFDLYRSLIGYVPQDDIIHKELTVGNALRYAAKLRLPPDTSDREIQQRIDNVLKQVGMIGQKEQVISRLSGGQRKRVSIAAELLAEPPLFFLDEPTSGLDPGLEKQMMETLRYLADQGQTILLVTHATANITQCDHVCFLSQGRLVYFGPPEEAFQFFKVSSDDFADIYNKLDDADPKQAQAQAIDWERRFRQSPYYKRYVRNRQKQAPKAKQKAPIQKKTSTHPRINPLRQFGVLCRRYLDLVLRDRLLSTVLIAIMPIIGVLLLIISESNWLIGDSQQTIKDQLAAELAAGEKSATYAIAGSSQRLLFMMALAAVLLGLFAAAYEIVKERSVYQRERMVSLQLIPYLSSKVVVLGGFALFQCFLLLLVISLKVEIPSDGVFLPAPVEIYITLVIGTLAAIMMGMTISALAPNTNSVIYIVLLALFFQIIFAGVIFDLPNAAGELSRLTLTRWVMEGLGSSVDMHQLNTLTQTRFQPDPMTREISTEIDKPVIKSKTTCEIVTEPETITQTQTFTPTAQTIASEQEFQINYTPSAAHLCWTWILLLGFGIASGTGTLVILKRQDVG